MNYLICVDDTDMPGTTGTGKLLQQMTRQMARYGLCTASSISRHQLFVHRDVPFTSHNSAMCFEICPVQENIVEITDFIVDFIELRSQKGSDPGLCIVPLAEGLDHDLLIDYGRRAKKEVLTKESAYDLADTLDIHLSEHGGTGQGVIGALAGAGLRLSGNDGRYRGWYELGRPGDVIRIDHLCEYDFVDDLVPAGGLSLKGQTHVHIGSERTKTVRINGRQVIVLMENDTFESQHAFRTITKQEAKIY